MVPNLGHLKCLFATSTFTFHWPKQVIQPWPFQKKGKCGPFRGPWPGREGEKMGTNNTIYFTFIAYNPIKRRTFFILCFQCPVPCLTLINIAKKLEGMSMTNFSLNMHMVLFLLILDPEGFRFDPSTLIFRWGFLAVISIIVKLRTDNISWVFTVC